MTNPSQPRWEGIAILLTVIALLPASLSVQMERPFIPKPIAWGMLAVLLALMLFIFSRRIVRVMNLRREDEGDGPQTPSPPGQPRGKP